MTTIRMNPYAVEADNEGTLIDVHRAEWLTARRPLGIGMRLVYDCDTPDCGNPDHGRPVPLLDPGGWTGPSGGLLRAIVTAVSASGNVEGRPEWAAVLEGVAIGRMGVPLLPVWRERLGIVEAAEALEREVLVQRFEDGELELYAVPDDDEELPGGRPAWNAVEAVDFDLANAEACPCGSRWRFGCCHGSP